MSKDTNGFMNFVDESSEKAVIEIYGTIGGYDYDTWKKINTINIMRRELNRLKELNTKNIEVRICSYGGCVDHALAIHDALRDHTAKITTVVNSYCASAATVIAMAGDVRKISKNALFLIHQCSSSVWGNAHDLEMELESQRTTNEVIYNIYKEHCAKDEKELRELFDYDNGNGKWLTAQEVLDYGFATEIYNEDKATTAKAASIDRRMMDKLHLPPFPAGYEQPEEKTFNVRELASALGTELKEFFKPKNSNQNINQNQIVMTKFNAKFACLSLLFAAMADTDYDPEKGQSFTDAQMNELEKQLKELADLKDKFTKLEADKKASDEKVTALTAENKTITAERDSYKAKYEAAPALTNPVNGKDGKETTFEDSMDNDPYYQSITKQLKQF